MIFLTLLISVGLVACGDNSIVGNWEADYEGTAVVVTFMNNTYKVVSQIENDEIDSGTYALGKAGMFTIESEFESQISYGNCQGDKMTLSGGDPFISINLNRIQ